MSGFIVLTLNDTHKHTHTHTHTLNLSLIMHVIGAMAVVVVMEGKAVKMRSTVKKSALGALE